MQNGCDPLTPSGDSVGRAPICVAALYQFTRFADFAALRAPLLALCEEEGIKGTLLLAAEGINGTVAGSHEGIARLLAHVRALPGCADVDVKLSGAEDMPFHRMKVRLKREIVTMGQPDIDPLSVVGTYVEPQDWNALISDPDTIVIDTRNDYEVAVGTFAGAIDPHTATFRDFPEWFRTEREKLLAAKREGGKPPKVAMFCTGGIRCEKSTAFLKQEGVEDVFHLKGGILKYLETVPEEESLWQGECFVFDQRVTIRHGLVQGSHALCHACRRPVNAEDQTSPLYEEGVSCPACHHERSDEQRASYRERHRQENLAAARGELHVGAVRRPENAVDTDAD
ncbi:MAG: rhodanese-related sulfurtransferase [Novosphingobium sp.]|nr:rhodanese-related sulfurtransferase [Novosphingobium sp.]